ncbi:MAG: hypothetical protein ACYS3N_00260 [Planctomycetota bacterium]|jgi:hypothetical protein
MRNRILLAALLLLPVAGIAQAEDGQLGVTLDLTYASRWMSRGRPVWGDSGGFFETIDLDLYGTGLGVAVTHRSATGGGWVNKQRLEYTVYYGGTILDGYGDSFLTSGACCTKFKVNWIYKNWYDNPRNLSNVQAWVLALSWPKILNTEGLVPYYVATYDAPAGSDYKSPALHSAAGWVHRFGLGYDLELAELPAPLHLSSDIAFTDGFRLNADHDWSYVTFGIQSTFKIDENTSFIPRLYYQISMDESVNQDKDVTYCVLSMKHKF